MTARMWVLAAVAATGPGSMAVAAAQAPAVPKVVETATIVIQSETK